jgi:L-aspartate oxidase
LKSGASLVNESAARAIVEDGGKLIAELERLGVTFDRGENGDFSLALEGGHKSPRVFHSQDRTGGAISATLIEHLEDWQRKFPNPKQSRILILENTFCLSLINYEQVCLGAHLESGSQKVRVLAQHTILATGGLGQLFSRSTNPRIATGDGIALAYRAGAALIDLEFIQFHPTALHLENAPAFLISEAIRGAGAKLIDSKNKRFMPNFHLDGELATRDVVARAIHATMQSQNGEPVGLDLRSIGKTKLEEHFPNILKTCRHFGIDPLITAIPVSPAAHYSMGGIAADTFGQTSIERLYAIGECAATGLHGANRLASNSLLEAGVMAMRVAELLKNGRFSYIKSIDEPIAKVRTLPPVALPKDVEQLRQLMYKNGSLIRSGRSLNDALRFMRESAEPVLPTDRRIVESANIGLVCELIARSALMREESRGAHFREDYAEANNDVFKTRLSVSSHGHEWLEVEHPSVTKSGTSLSHLIPIKNDRR